MSVKVKMKMKVYMDEGVDVMGGKAIRFVKMKLEMKVELTIS